MSRRGMVLILGALLGVAGIVAILAAGDDGDGSASAASPVSYRVTQPALRPAPGAETSVRARRKSKQPEIRDLITTDPVAVDAGAARVIALSCPKGQGVALDGGVIVPPTSQVVISTLSRANPNPPYTRSLRTYYVGVRNFANATTFRGTLVCAKGIRLKR